MTLVSGDGGFDLLAQKIREVHGKRVEVYGVPKLTANFPINPVSQFILIESDLLSGKAVMWCGVEESPPSILVAQGTEARLTIRKFRIVRAKSQSGYAYQRSPDPRRSPLSAMVGSSSS
ncbi:NYN domain-containing protein [Chromohalobacter sp.]|uniref:NYN domain-containing protein n=1 Tax=Chromohalobacter sp. TaxID=50740 RepID=UPI00338F9778